MDAKLAVNTYDAHLSLLREQAAVLMRVLEGWLSETDVKLHSVTMRVKSRETLLQKLARPDRTYGDFWDITDVIGLRITTYFEDSIDVVAQAIEKHLHVDFAHSTDKRRQQDSSAFGYRSLHYVCGFGSERLPGLPENARCEIQVRTLLQHAWAEIEHDLGYKTRDAIPVAVRRRFSRVASLLEIADQEFMAVRKELESYASQLDERFEEGGEDLQIDRLSLTPLLNRNEVRELDAAIAQKLGRPLDDDAFFPDYLVRMLSLSGISSVRQALEEIVTHKNRILAIVEPYFAFATNEWKLSPAQMQSIYRGYSLFFLAHVALLASPALGINKAERLARFYGELDYPDDPRTAQRIAGALLTAFRE